MDTGNFRALTVGGGIGGLCLAQGLKQAGIAFTVFERDTAPTSRLQGYRLSLTPGGSLALRSNLPDALWERIEQARTAQLEGISFVSEQLEPRFFKKTPPPVDAVRRFGSISRVTLREILLTGLGDDVVFGKRLARYEPLADQSVRCLFEDGSAAEGQLLVGADGTHSVVREQFLPHAVRVESGAYAIAAQVPLDETTRRDLMPPPWGKLRLS